MSSPSEQQIEDAWKQFEGRLEESWGTLTNDSLDRFEGKREQPEGYIQEEAGEQRKAIPKRLDPISDETEYSL